MGVDFTDPSLTHLLCCFLTNPKGGNMFKKLVLALGVFCASFAMAAEYTPADLARELAVNTMDQARATALNWVVGDACHYNLNISNFIKGKMDMVIREQNAEGFWIDQNMDLGFAGKQTASILVDPNTGAIKKILVNGQEQQIPDQSDMEVIEVKESSVTVPAGTFEAIYMKIHDKKQNQDTEQWVNPKLIPISGALKSIGQTQMGPVTSELVSFEKK